MKKKKKWTRVRHRVVAVILKFFMKIVAKIHFGYKYEKFKKHKEPYLILYNHQTVWDQFLVGLIFNTKTYYVMSDDLASIRFVSKLLEFLVHPIPYKKSSVDFTILKNLKQVASEGGSIAISPEGNRTFSGKTEYIKRSTARMIQFLKLPVAIVHIDGGFGRFPRWADKPRKGAKMYGKVYKVYRYEDYKDLTTDEIYKMLKEDLYVNEANPSGPFKSKHQAEYIERAIYYCPHCGFTHFESEKDILTCKTCGMKVRYNAYKQFEGVNCEAPYQNINEWYEAQTEQILKIDFDKVEENTPFFVDNCQFFEVIFRKKKHLIEENAEIAMYKNRLVVKCQEETHIFTFDQILSSGVFGKNKIDIFVGNKIYQFKGDKHFNAIKYVNLFYKYRLDKGDEQNDDFLGL